MVRLGLVMAVFICLSAIAHSQDITDKNPVLLKSYIRQSRADTNRIKLQLKLSDYYLSKKGWLNVNKDSALLCLNQALDLSRALHSAKWENEVLLLIGSAYLHVDDAERGSPYFLNVIRNYHSRHNFDMEAQTWERLGDNFSRGPKTIGKKIEYYQQARIVYGQASERLKAILAFKKIADMHMVEGNYDLAESELKAVVQDLKGIGFKNLHYTYDLLASLSKLKGNFHQELFYKNEVVSSMEATGDFSYASYFYFNLAMTYYDLGLYPKSLIYFQKALPFCIGEKNYDRYYEALTGMVKAMLSEGKNAQALDFIIRKTKESPPANETQRQWMDAAFGACYEKTGETKKAEFYYNDIIKLSDIDLKNQDYEDYLRNYSIISNFYVTTARYQKAGYYLSKLLNVPSTLLRPSVMSQIQLLQFKVDSASGKWVSAVRHYQQHKKINDSLYNATNKKLFDEVQIRNESERKDRNLELQSKNIQLLQKQSQLEQNQADRAKAIKNVFIGGFFMVSVLLALGYNRYRLKQRSNLQLLEKQLIISEKNTALEKLLRDNEWLVREAHHRVKNNMQTIVSLLSSQSLYLKDEAAYDAVADSRHRIQTMSLIHQTLYSSANMSTVVMRGYIGELVDYLSESFKVKQTIVFRKNIEGISLDVVQAVPVGLILNEAITNSLKHAFPHTSEDSLTISLELFQDDKILLTIIDNGKGLPKEFDNTGMNSFGVKLMRGLAEELGGDFSIWSDHGTTVSIRFKKMHLCPATVEQSGYSKTLYD